MAGRPAVGTRAGSQWSRAPASSMVPEPARSALHDAGGCPRPGRPVRPGPQRRLRPLPGCASQPASASAGTAKGHPAHTTPTPPAIRRFPAPGSRFWLLSPYLASERPLGGSFLRAAGHSRGHSISDNPVQPVPGGPQLEPADGERPQAGGPTQDRSLLGHLLPMKWTGHQPWMPNGESSGKGTPPNRVASGCHRR